MNSIILFRDLGTRQELVKAAGVKRSPSANTILSDRNLVQEPACFDRISFRTKLNHGVLVRISSKIKFHWNRVSQLFIAKEKVVLNCYFTLYS